MDSSLQKYNRGTKLIQWSERIAACRSSGMPVKVWCAQEGISEKTYYNWQKKVFRAAQSQGEFVEVWGGISNRRTGVATVSVGGYSIEIHSGADGETLKALFEAVRSC